jgi:hypothetical protein
MKQIKETALQATIEAGGNIAIDVVITDENSVKKSPQEIVIDNNSGCIIGVVYLDGADEVEVFTAHPEWYDYIPLVAGRSTAILPSSLKYIYLKKLSGTATGNIDLYLKNYFRG